MICHRCASVIVGTAKLCGSPRRVLSLCEPCFVERTMHAVEFVHASEDYRRHVRANSSDRFQVAAEAFNLGLADWEKRFIK